jgi:hypothetical protein
LSLRGRYWIFAFNNIPRGGLNDFKFSFNNIEEFEDRCLDIHDSYREYQILDTKTNFHIDGDLGTITRWVCKNIGDEHYGETAQ